MQLSGSGDRVALSIFAVPLQVPGADELAEEMEGRCQGWLGSVG